MVIAVLEMRMPEGHEVDTVRALRAFWDSTCALPGCSGGGVYQEVGRPETALYVEIWEEEVQLAAHIRSRAYDRLLALMETAAVSPELRFNVVGETRGLAWVEQLRLRPQGTGGEGA
jgi:quinol monooxygenase YgiN